MALGVPVLVSKTAIDSYYFDDSLVLFFESGNAKDLAEKMILLLQDDALRKALAARAKEFIRTHNWDARKSVISQLDYRAAGRISFIAASVLDGLRQK